MREVVADVCPNLQLENQPDVVKNGFYSEAAGVVVFRIRA